jgi:hypothetical protein
MIVEIIIPIEEKRVQFLSSNFPHFFPTALQTKTAIYSLRIHCGGKLMADREGFEASNH